VIAEQLPQSQIVMEQLTETIPRAELCATIGVDTPTIWL
jgi:hypothetical protein